MKKMFTLFAVLLLTTAGFSQTQSWSLTGNSGTTSSNFLGTTDNNPIIFKANGIMAGFSGYDQSENVAFGFKALMMPSEGWGNVAMGVQAMQWSGGLDNTALGHWSLMNVSGGSYNVAVGGSAMAHAKGNHNVGIGSYTLMQNQANESVGVGTNAGKWNTTGVALTAVGSYALTSNSTGNNNTAMGYNALYNNTTSDNNTAVGTSALQENTGPFNTSIGTFSLHRNTTGEHNTALGNQAMEKNTTGWWNVGLGSGALFSNETGFQNTAAGTSAMWFNTTGEQNVALGEEALAGNITGNWNTAVGTRALFSVENGDDPEGYGRANNNTAIGYESYKNITTGSFNVGVGLFAGVNVTTGNNNVAIGGNSFNFNKTGNNNVVVGYGANVSTDGLHNATAIGYGTVVTASNQVRIGNDQVTSIGGQVSWSTLSDGRVKKNVSSEVPGLDFINQLSPVTYNIDQAKLRSIIGEDDDETALRSFSEDTQLHTGFIAQDVEKAAQALGYEFSGVDAAESENGLYGIRYAEFVVPLVKAVQELSAQNQVLQSQNQIFQSQIEELQQIIKKENNQEINQENRTSVILTSSSLEQNIPNPFDESTIIPYTLPHTFSSARIVITNAGGKIMKQISLAQPGKGNVNIDTGFIEAGVYYYSLYVDEKLIETKRMIKR